MKTYRGECVQFSEGFTDFSKHTRATLIGSTCFLLVACTGNYTAGKTTVIGHVIPELVSHYSGCDSLLVGGGDSWVGYDGQVYFTPSKTGKFNLQGFYMYEVLS